MSDIDFYILCGQSNAVGSYTTGPNAPSAPNAVLHDPLLLDARGVVASEIAFLDAMAANTTHQVHMLKYAVGGTGLGAAPGVSDWNAGSRGELLDSMVAAAVSAIAALVAQGHTVHLSGLIFMQGETDAAGPDAATFAPAYEQNLRDFIDAVRQRLNAPDLPIVLGEINPTADLTGNAEPDEPSLRDPNMQTVIDAQHEVADTTDGVTLVDTSDLPMRDDVHFAPEGLRILGVRFADVFGDVDPALTEFSFDQSLPGSTGVDDITVTAPGTARIVLDTGDDRAGGGGQRDQIFGQAGADRLFGMDGNDLLIGGADRDELFGGNGQDVLWGGSGDDYLEAGAGDDFLIGHIGNDTMLGDSGNDTLYGKDGADILFGGDGADLMSGESGNDDISGDAGADVLYGGAGGDVMKGGIGADRLFGEDGADTLDGGVGADTMQGGAGNDIYIVDAAGDIVDESVAGSNGIDTVRSSISFSLADAAHAKGVIENVTLLGALNLNALGNNLNNILIGNSGANTLNGGLGVDLLQGGAGNDNYAVDNAGDLVDESITGSSGIDLVRSSVTFNLVNAAQARGAIENVTLIGNASISVYGNALSNTLIGAAGNNLLAGGLGNDTLTGGAGSDSFVFNTALNSLQNVDRIMDMNEAGNDTIRLAGSIFSALNTGVLAASTFKISSAGATDADDHIVYNRSTGELFYDADANAKGAAIRFAILDPGLALTAADFFVV